MKLEMSFPEQTWPQLRWWVNKSLRTKRQTRWVGENALISLTSTRSLTHSNLHLHECPVGHAHWQRKGLNAPAVRAEQPARSSSTQNLLSPGTDGPFQGAVLNAIGPPTPMLQAAPGLQLWRVSWLKEISPNRCEDVTSHRQRSGVSSPVAS